MYGALSQNDTATPRCARRSAVSDSVREPLNRHIRIRLEGLGRASQRPGGQCDGTSGDALPETDRALGEHTGQADPCQPPCPTRRSPPLSAFRRPEFGVIAAGVVHGRTPIAGGHKAPSVPTTATSHARQRTAAYIISAVLRCGRWILEQRALTCGARSPGGVLVEPSALVVHCSLSSLAAVDDCCVNQRRDQSRDKTR